MPKKEYKLAFCAEGSRKGYTKNNFL